MAWTMSNDQNPVTALMLVVAVGFLVGCLWFPWLPRYGRGVMYMYASIVAWFLPKLFPRMDSVLRTCLVQQLPFFAPWWMMVVAISLSTKIPSSSFESQFWVSWIHHEKESNSETLCSTMPLSLLNMNKTGF